MADNTVVHLGENSPEQVAYKLMRDIARAEKKNLEGVSINSDRQWILSTYRECLKIARNPFYEE